MGRGGSKGIAKNVDMHVGHRVRDRRAELGLTQKDLAKTLGLSYQQVQKYETGANRISAGKLYEMAMLLDVAVSDFFDGLDPTRAGEPMEHGGRNRSAIEMARNFDEIKDTEMRAAVSGLVKSIAGKPRHRK